MSNQTTLTTLAKTTIPQLKNILEIDCGGTMDTLVITATDNIDFKNANGYVVDVNQEYLSIQNKENKIFVGENDLILKLKNAFNKAFENGTFYLIQLTDLSL